MMTPTCKVCGDQSLVFCCKSFEWLCFACIKWANKVYRDSKSNFNGIERRKGFVA